MYYSVKYREELKESLVQIKKGLTIHVASHSSEIPFYNEHKYELRQTEIEQIFKRKVYREIINTKAFKRLKDIHFLGAIDYVIDTNGPKPNKRHTRFQHSLGVARLALQFSKERNLSVQQEILCVVAALLHDIGHAPLSHSLESVFKEQFGISHHKSGEKIIRGEIPLGDSLYKILNKWEIDPFEILSIINGTGTMPYREIFSYAINIDTIEGILRSRTYLHNNLSYTPSQILTALLIRSEESIQVMDKFWTIKDEVYSKLINSRFGVIADFICQKYMQDNSGSFRKSYYYGSESELKKIHSALFNKLKYVAHREAYEILPNTDEISCFRRKFIINKDVKLISIKSINERYTQSKTTNTYKIIKKGRNCGYRIGGSQGSLRLL